MDLEGAGSVLWLSQQRLELSSPRPSFFIFRAACLTLDEEVFNRKPEKTLHGLLWGIRTWTSPEVCGILGGNSAVEKGHDEKDVG